MIIFEFCSRMRIMLNQDDGVIYINATTTTIEADAVITGDTSTNELVDIVE